MDVKECDIKECRNQYKPGLGNSPIFLGKRYDLCSECYDKMVEWVEEYLDNGAAAAGFAPQVTYYPHHSVPDLQPAYAGDDVIIGTIAHPPENNLRYDRVISSGTPFIGWNTNSSIMPSGVILTTTNTSDGEDE